ncbi:hypothetical protein EPUS_04607 [Endocarpon pusillum Z07020]|uniref:BHLH domain-containing protein n=1 Tax=Endocarpon pusillum (strain Z07020 / HMAS-L-300199) TaxID=1263415 RepID=U1GDH3_ENDPU|nr:uncharacterized protein EPUS_04607 [Endocarpon pusillum Z07020]ERF75627.1 hypothetical protein EPUS_04607 [Endocarpon pusillum Z07020]
MPTPTLPLTPAASTEIAAQERPWSSSASESSITLPPPALQSAAEIGSQNSKATGSLAPTDTRSVNRPASASTKKLRPISEDEPFTLPSPPTRSRKIIHMKPPRPQSETQSPVKRRKITTASTPDSPAAHKASSSSSSSLVNNISKPTKKAIRKTAHSLIERRRRSKMNDAFATLKDMIPACRSGDERDGNGKEMHKLDVLNAGIEYLAYLETCLEKMNERQWEGKRIGRRIFGQDDAEDMDTEMSKEDARAASAEKHLKSPSEHEYLRQQIKDQNGKKEKYPFMPPNTCHCHCHSNIHGEEELLRTAMPLTKPQPPSSNFSSQEYLTAHLTHHPTDATREMDIERTRDQEETTKTAAALLMLTSTDRRGKSNSNSNSTNITADARPRFSIIPTGTVNYHQTGTPTWKSHTQTLTPTPTSTSTSTIKTGLSVRDLLLK